MNDTQVKVVTHRRKASHVARQILTAFLFVFLTPRILVFLIMAHDIPDLFLHVNGTHVHHNLYGIFILVGTAAGLLFFAPTGPGLSALTMAYGVGLALTFDEFGMWLHLGGGYWQRASFDAIVVIAGVLGLIASAPELRRLRPHHSIAGILLLVAVIAFAVLLRRYVDTAVNHFSPKFHQIESQSPP